MAHLSRTVRHPSSHAVPATATTTATATTAAAPASAGTVVARAAGVLGLPVLPVLVLLCAMASADEGQAESGASRPAAAAPFGFSGFEIYKIDKKISLLRAADLDGDGMKDLLFANNVRARIEVFLRRKDPVPPKTLTGDPLPNELAYDSFYERKEILTEKLVNSLAIADLNGDGNLDVAFVGKPDEMVVAFGDGKGSFPTDVRFPADDASAEPGGLATGDLDGDGRVDLVRLAKGYSEIYRQSDKGGLQAPIRVPHSDKGVRGVDVRDLDGDGRLDLIHVLPASPRSIRVMFQRADGSLGAEISFRTTPWRALDFHDLAPGKGEEILVIQRTSGVMRSLRMQTRAANASNPFALGGAQMHAFEKGASAKPRAMDLGDVDGDGRIDIVVTEPGTARVAIYLQGGDGGLRGRRLYPSLSSSESVRVTDLTGDGRAEVIVLSSTERTVGISSLEPDGMLPFPTMLNLPGTPKAIETGDINDDGRADLVVVVEKDKKRHSLIYMQGESGLPGQPLRRELTGLKNAPDGVMLMDIDQDGHADLLLFDRFGPMKIWLGDGKGGFKDPEQSGIGDRGGLVNRLARGAAQPGDLDGDGKPELLVASKNFARAIHLVRGEGLQVTDQANAASSRAKVKGAAALDVDGDGKAEVALFDSEKKTVTVLHRNETGVYEPGADMPVGALEYLAMFAADVNGDGRTDLVVHGKDAFTVLYAAGANRELSELFTVESSMRDARLYDFAIGDLNGDGGPDIAALDAANRAITVFSYAPASGFKQRISWRLYEKKMHENTRRDGGAREIIVKDLNGDGLEDIAVLIHDRLLVYLQ